MDDELKTLRGTVTRLHFSSPKWSAGKLLVERQDITRRGEVSVVGSFYAAEGEYVILEGDWKQDPKYGRQFSVSRQIREIGVISVQGLASWLAHHGEAKGIGPVKADKIAREYREGFTRMLRDDPEQIAIFAQIPLVVVQKLAQEWFEHEELNVIGTKLAMYELTQHQIRALYFKYKSNLVKLLEDNPYLIVGDVEGFGFKKIDEIARKMGVAANHPGRLAAAALHCLLEEKRDGSTCMERGNLIGTATELLNYREDDGDTLLSQAIDRLVANEKKIVGYPTKQGRLFYALPSCWKHESFIMGFLKVANRENPHFGDDVLPLVAEKFPWLDESQVRAVQMALRNWACLITGGAGAGKTSILECIVRMYQDDNLRVKLCAPTGKASRRIEEVVGHHAQTIHRMLGYKPPHGFPDTKLDTDVVICDESSMIDSSLAYHLFRAIGDNTALILVGDHHQLPPVGAGALLRDCIQNELLPLAILNKCHRQAGALKKNCSAILDGEIHPTDRGEDNDLPWTVLRSFESAQDVLVKVERLFASELRDKLGVDPVKDVQFLTPQHPGLLGTRSLNVLLQRLHQKHRGVDVDPVALDARPKLYVGDKVIQTRNDYKLDVMNGHQGMVTKLDPLVVDFGNERVVNIPKDSKGAIELAYALTVHKVQGSQFPVVVFVCHKSHTWMLHRHLIYTATTRAQKSCVILGDDAGVSRAAKVVKANERRTLLPLLTRRDGDE